MACGYQKATIKSVISWIYSMICFDPALSLIFDSSNLKRLCKKLWDFHIHIYITI